MDLAEGTPAERFAGDMVNEATCMRASAAQDNLQRKTCCKRTHAACFLSLLNLLWERGLLCWQGHEDRPPQRNARRLVCGLQENVSLDCHKLAGHVLMGSSAQVGGGRHTSAISIAILATLTRLVSSADIPRTTLAANLLLPASLALSSLECLLDDDP